MRFLAVRNKLSKICQRSLWALALSFLFWGWPGGTALAAAVELRLSPAEHGAYLLELGPLTISTGPPGPDQGKQSGDGGGGRTPHQVGSGRELPGLQTPAEMAARLNWRHLAEGGQVAALELGSYGAAGLRLGLLVERVADGAEFSFYGRGGAPVHRVTGATINRVIRRNLAAGGGGVEARTYWSPMLFGDFIGLEIYLPEPLLPEALSLALPALSHLYLPVLPLNTLKFAPGASADCHRDVSCEPEWATEKNAVAMIYYQAYNSSRGEWETFQCSAALLNDRENSGTPYLITAEHCIDRQEKASSLETLWFYHSTACGSADLNPRYVHQQEGAELLRRHSATDSSLLKLSGDVPAGVTFAGWSVAVPSLEAGAAGLHHPEGDLQKINIGTLLEFLDCTIIANESHCNVVDSANGNYINLINSEGSIERGASGSGLFLADGGYLVGSLSSGLASCGGNFGGSNIYGRFDRAFRDGGFWQWLDNSQQYLRGGSFLRMPALVYRDAEPPPPVSGEGGWGGGCFIATAAYGSEWAPQVAVLREFRDRVLLRSVLGERLVEFYYRHSPPLAARLAEKPVARAVVRAALLPVVGLTRWVNRNIP